MTEHKLAELGARVAAHEDALPLPAPSEQTRRLLAERAAARLRPPRAARGAFPVWARLSLAALLLIGVFVLREAISWRTPLSFTVGTAGQGGVLMAWESAPPEATLPIRFSDGTQIELEPNARARVVANGAQAGRSPAGSSWLPLCDTGSGQCVECLVDGHCDELGERCSLVLGRCAQPCSAELSCSDEPICDLDLGFCVECRQDSDCEDDEVCRGSECIELDDDDEDEDDDD